MEKIPTIFDRDWESNRGVIDKLSPDIVIRGEGADTTFGEALGVATEKLDGTNVRLTVRNHTLVRVEARINPSKVQKAEGITEPWYRDAWQINAGGVDPGDRHLVAAAVATGLAGVPDGEWSGEAIGPKIQGNPLDLEKLQVVLFSLGRAPVIENVPTTFDELRTFLPQCKSALNPEKGIEGIVWHGPHGEMAKIKVKDFK